MQSEKKTESKTVLIIFLAVMAAMIISGIVFYAELKELMNRPRLYPHVLFAHIVAVTLFFANAIVGMLWESRSLASGKKEVILHTYNTVAWLDARFSSPLIVASVITGVTLTLMLGDIWKIGWLFWAFVLFMFSGATWIISDIPTQYKIKELMENLSPEDPELPAELVRLLKLRLKISLLGVLPLFAVFILMVYKPGIPSLVPG
ncbi:MAG: DUF2269 family protein [Spirochaetales bacterium]|uniref:DUF2269 family protein n=1 Tax=Candidatus Thalassospirochaeta sargassi TaxID=3119039 RepID=A0AAJ1IFZ7_9SPIO|nr:DUF2269 family protein [Spirochaetales bacterium]